MLMNIGNLSKINPEFEETSSGINMSSPVSDETSVPGFVFEDAQSKLEDTLVFDHTNCEDRQVKDPLLLLKSPSVILICVQGVSNNVPSKKCKTVQ